MNPPVILLLSNDPQVEQAVRTAVCETRHGLRHVSSVAEAVALLAGPCDDVDLALIDLDPGLHGHMLLNAAADKFSIIVLTSLEGNYVGPIARTHGAIGCQEKPLDPERLRAAITAALDPRRSTTAA